MSLANDLPETSEKMFELNGFPLFDIDEALKTIGDGDILKDLLRLMVNESVPDDISLMQSAYLEQNWNKVQQIAHKIKGGAVYVGTIRMKIACQYLERYWKTGQTECLEPLYHQVLKIIDETMKEITQWLQNSK